MSKDKFRVNRNVASQLDASVVGRAKLPYGAFWWNWFSGRTYERNSPSEFDSKVMCLGFLITSILSYFFLRYVPLYLTGLMIFTGMNVGAMFVPIHYANKFVWGGIINVAIGAAGLYFHPNLHLEIFSYHFEYMVFYGYLIGGGLAVYRRLWNSFIWKRLDNFVLRYYKKYDLSMETPPQLITDYQKAYWVLSEKVGELLSVSSKHPEIKDFLSDKTLEHFNQAITLIEQETKRCRQ